MVKVFQYSKEMVDGLKLRSKKTVIRVIFKIKILPSFTPGYYEKGDGKDLGSVLEFKSEVKIGLDIFENSKLSYSYSHISNNDWGETNPGTDNQQITFSKNF